MKNTYSSRDAILVVGPSASGKTFLLNHLRKVITDVYGLPHELKSLSDSHTILARVREDDMTGGFHHYHPWDSEKKLGHTHEIHPEIVPFTLAGNLIAHAFMRDFFIELTGLPRTGVLRFAEWSAGTNMNDRSDPAYLTDLSFATIGRLLMNGSIPSEGLQRILAVLHVSTNSEYRWQLNKNRTIPSEHEIAMGTASWPLDESAMRIFGGDDFNVGARSILQAHNIPVIKTLHNTGEQHMEYELERILPKIVGLWHGGETGNISSIRNIGRR